MYAKDLQPGDVINYHGHLTTIERHQEENPNPFGLPWFRYWASAENREGFISFGPSATVELISRKA